eukprot:m.285191 g.285191  ORF g.285191 m.285191 type:complete len:63 (-) comp11317_c0_seq1:1396-1584(-)
MAQGGFDDSDIDFASETTPTVSGYFEVTVNGELVHSKKNGDGFPNAEVVKRIAAKIEAALNE